MSNIGTIKHLNGHFIVDFQQKVHKCINEVFPQTTVKIVPGPGTYVNQDAIELNLNGQYHLSNHRNNRAKVFNPPRSARFNRSSNYQIK
jgi:hypothetical protein